MYYLADKPRNYFGKFLMETKKTIHCSLRYITTLFVLERLCREWISTEKQFLVHAMVGAWAVSSMARFPSLKPIDAQHVLPKATSFAKITPWHRTFSCFASTSCRHRLTMPVDPALVISVAWEWSLADMGRHFVPIASIQTVMNIVGQQWLSAICWDDIMCSVTTEYCLHLFNVIIL